MGIIFYLPQTIADRAYVRIEDVIAAIESSGGGVLLLGHIQLLQQPNAARTEFNSTPPG